MKKLTVFILCIATALLLSGCADGVSMLYTESAEKDGFNIAVNKTANCCFVGSFEYTDETEITVPDEYNGIPITRLGGYFGRGVPSPFTISLAEKYMNAKEASDYSGVFGGDISEYEIKDEYSVENIKFVLNIGKNIKSIEKVVMDNYYPHINEDNSITFYHPVVEINCSEDNKYFFSKDSRLYDKKSGEQIEGFAYE